MNVSKSHFIFESLVPQAASNFTNGYKNGFGYIVYGSYDATPKIFKQDFNHSSQLGELLAILTSSWVLSLTVCTITMPNICFVLLFFLR